MHILNFLFSATLLLSIPSFAKNNDSTCAKAEQNAQEDINSGEIRYYFFGIVAPDIRATQELSRKYGVKAATMGCMVPPGTICYNAEVDKYMKQKYGKTISELMAESIVKQQKEK